MSSQLADMSLEEAMIQLNSGTLKVADDSSSKVIKENSQTTPSGCSLGEVKDAALPLPAAPVSSPSFVPFDGVDIADPVELLLILDENLLSGETSLHDWQIRFMMDFAKPNHTKESPFQACVQACNSSGKDKYIIAACAVWLCMRYTEAECPITSSSGDQLDKQTCKHIDRLTNKANAIFGPLWKINYRYYEFQHKGKLGNPLPSVITCFATDEAGKAEGYHPADAGKKMAIFTSETKSIPDDITSALERCTGFTHRVDASSPGLPSGYFYNTCTSAIPRDSVEDIKQLRSTQVLLYKITAYQCSHITEAEIERIASKLPGGRNNVVFKSSILAEFGTTDEMVVIPSSFVWRAVDNKTPWLKEQYNTGGLDLSDGGAETVLVVRNGNKLIKTIPFRFEDTEDTITFLQEKFVEYDLNYKEALVFADCCGIGKPMINSLKRKGWSNMRYVDSRNTASEFRVYSNRGTELFFNVRKLMEGGELIIENDKLMITQLSTRYYKINTKNIHALLTKLEQRSRGYPSPDRADALNLAFWNYKSTRKEEETPPPFKEEEDKKEKQKIVGDFDLNSWATRGQKQYTPEHITLDENSNLREELLAYNKNKQQARQLIAKN